MEEHRDISGYFYHHKRFYDEHIAQDDPGFVQFLKRNSDPLEEPGTQFVAGKTLLHKAVETYDAALVRRIIDEKSIDLTARDENQLTPLMTACALSPTSLDFPSLREIFFTLLDALPKKKRFNFFSRNLLNAVDIRGHSALEISFYSKNLLFASELLRRGARTRTSYQNLNLLHIFSVIPSELGGNEPPSWAGSLERYKQVHTEVAYLLYSRKISPSVEFLGFGNTPLYASILYYNETLCKILLGTDFDEEILAVKNSMNKKFKPYFSLTKLFSPAPSPVFACIEYVLGDDPDDTKQYSRQTMLRNLIFVGANMNVGNPNYFYRSPLQLYFRLKPDHPELKDNIGWDLIVSDVDLSYTLPKDIPGLLPEADWSTFDSSLFCGNHLMIEKVLQATNINVNAPCVGLNGLRPIEVVCNNYREYAALYAQNREAVHVNFDDLLEVLKTLVMHGCELEFERAEPLAIEIEKGRTTPIHPVSQIFNTLCFSMGRENYRQYHLCQKLINQLIQLMADVDFCRPGGPSLLVIAAHQDLTAVSRELVRTGANLDFAYKLGACSRKGLVPHRIQSYEGADEYGPAQREQPEDISYICDVCQRQVPLTQHLKVCEDPSCDTLICEECFMFTQHENSDSTEVMNIAKRRGSCGLISMLYFAHTSIGRKFVEKHIPFLYYFDLLQNAGLNSEKLIRAVTSENWQQMGFGRHFLKGFY